MTEQKPRGSSHSAAEKVGGVSGENVTAETKGGILSLRGQQTYRQTNSWTPAMSQQHNTH